MVKITKVSHRHSSKSCDVLDSEVGDGYVKKHHGSMPDVDVDYDSNRRQEVKEYLERRYNKNGAQRVFSAGTFITERIKSVIKDVARVHKVSVSTTNYINAILDDNLTWTDLMRLCCTTKKVRDFVQKNWEVFEEIQPLLGQPRSAGVHASAVIITPEIIKGKKVDCFDLLPIKKVDGMLVSELSGNDIDAIGILKNDVLGIAELSRLSEILGIIKEQTGRTITMLQIVTEHMDDPKVFETLQKGLTQGVFQMSSDGMTRFLRQMKPSNINDLIAANALFRPATLNSGAAKTYVDCKNGLIEPEYLWGTYEILKDTYGVATYQEQFALLVRKIGNLSIGDGVNLVKAISKKKIEKIRKYKDKYMDGIKETGCPKEAAEKIWDIIEVASTYGFNKCISGDEIICKTGGNGERPLTIREMYLYKNDIKWSKRTGHFSVGGAYRYRGYGTSWSLSEDNILVKNKIVNIYYSGIRPLYRITLENGATIDVTNNHKHPTPRGIKRTDELVVGVDEMYCRVAGKNADTTYRFTDKGGLNNPIYHSNENIEHYTLNSVKGHEGFIERDSNYTRLQYYMENLKKDYCEVCGEKGKRLEVHHINGDHSDCGVNYSNLQTLCVSCHKKAHYKMGRVKHGERGVAATPFKVISIEYIGYRDVYDVEMADPYHSFTTGNGVVTCNSHATAYALTAYVGAWLKTYYPIAFYTVLLKWVSSDKLPSLMNEMREIGDAQIVNPDINVSGSNFYTDYKENKIYWSLARIKFMGAKATAYIEKERAYYGNYYSLDEFIDRIFRQKLKKYESWDDADTLAEFGRCPVNARNVRNLIISGAFDKCEGIQSVTERYGMLIRAAEKLGFQIKEDDVPPMLIDKEWFWCQQQIAISGMGAIDYETIFRETPKPSSLPKYVPIHLLSDIDYQNAKVSVCATVSEVEEKSYKDSMTGEKKTYGKILLQQNTDVIRLLVWNDAWVEKKDCFMGKKDGMIVAAVLVKYSEFDEGNVLQINKRQFVVNVS